jgi:DNA-binding response OmpR family regulator
MARILVIDDEQSIAELIHDALTRYGHSVTMAFNGQQGLEMLSEDSFDLVVTDVCMPDLNGARIVTHVRNSSRPSTPVIGISGTPWLLDRVGCDAVLAKPFHLKSLIETVRRCTLKNFSISSEALSPPFPVNSQAAS